MENVSVIYISLNYTMEWNFTRITPGCEVSRPSGGRRLVGQVIKYELIKNAPELYAWRFCNLLVCVGLFSMGVAVAVNFVFFVGVYEYTNDAHSLDDFIKLFIFEVIL